MFQPKPTQDPNNSPLPKKAIKNLFKLINLTWNFYKIDSKLSIQKNIFRKRNLVFPAILAIAFLTSTEDTGNKMRITYLQTILQQSNKAEGVVLRSDYYQNLFSDLDDLKKTPAIKPKPLFIPKDECGEQKLTSLPTPILPSLDGKYPVIDGQVMDQDFNCYIVHNDIAVKGIKLNFLYLTVRYSLIEDILNGKIYEPKLVTPQSMLIVEGNLTQTVVLNAMKTVIGYGESVKINDPNDITAGFIATFGGIIKKDDLTSTGKIVTHPGAYNRDGELGSDAFGTFQFISPTMQGTIATFNPNQAYNVGLINPNGPDFKAFFQTDGPIKAKDIDGYNKTYNSLINNKIRNYWSADETKKVTHNFNFGPYQQSLISWTLMIKTIAARESYFERFINTKDFLDLNDISEKDIEKLIDLVEAMNYDGELGTEWASLPGGTQTNPALVNGFRGNTRQSLMLTLQILRANNEKFKWFNATNKPANKPSNKAPEMKIKRAPDPDQAVEAPTTKPKKVKPEPAKSKPKGESELTDFSI